MKARMFSVILLCSVIVLNLPLSSCAGKTSFATDLEKANNTPVSTLIATSQFVDVPQWAKEAVAFVSDRKIMVGVGNNRFDSQSAITKKEVAATLYRMAGSPEEIPEKHVLSNRTIHYADLQDTSVWYYNALLWCLNQNVIDFYRVPVPLGSSLNSSGYEAEPDKEMTRSDVVDSVFRFASSYMKLVDHGGEHLGNGEFSRGDIGTWEEFLAHGFIDPSKDNILIGGSIGEAWRWAVKQGIIFGYEDNSLRPENPVTRAEYAAIITRFIKHFDLQFE